MEELLLGAPGSAVTLTMLRAAPVTLTTAPKGADSVRVPLVEFSAIVVRVADVAGAVS